MYAKTDNENLIRDMASRTINHVNNKEREEFRIQREKEQKINNLENKINLIENNLNDIKNLLNYIINK